MKKGLKKPVSRYGPNMMRLLHRIEEKKQTFIKLPIGPIGLYIKIKENKWLFAVEKCLSRKFLTSFCCDNVQDMRILKTMMTEIFGPEGYIPLIITCSFMNEPYSDVECLQSNGNCTVYDILICNNPVVLNCLVDHKFIEKILLIEDASMAMNIVMKFPPKQYLCCYTIDGDKIYPMPNYHYYPRKQKSNNSLLLQPVSQDKIKKSKKLSQKYVRLIQKKIEEEKTQKTFFNVQKQNINDKETKKDDLKKKIILMNQKIEELENVSLNQPDVTSLNEEMMNQNKLLKTVQDEQIVVKNKIESLKSELDVIKGKKNETENYLNTAKEKWKTIEKKLDQLELEKEKCIVKKIILLSQKSKDQQQLTTIRKTLKEAKDEVQYYLLDAKSHRKQRINTRRKIEDLKSQIEEIESLGRQRLQNVNLNEFQKLKDKENKLAKTKKQITSISQSLDKLQERFEKRCKKIEEMRNSTCNRINSIFEMNINSREYSGELSFDHNNHSLGILAYTPSHISEERDSNLVNNIHNLSGGERSFVTVSFLMALFDISEMPFHILDECDVFMDALNRKQSFKMMIDKANEQRRTQFIFLTPLELNSYAFTQPHLVKIHKMEDPESSNVN